MQVFRAVVHNGQLISGFYTFEIPDNDWVADGLIKARERNVKYFMFHNTAKKPLTTLIYSESLEDLNELCNTNPGFANLWLELGVLHGKNSGCEEVMDGINKFVGQMNEELKESSESFREDVK